MAAGKHMKILNRYNFITLAIILFISPILSEEGVRLKDLGRIQGVRTNQLIGYGLVVGLPGTGDSRSRLASESMQNLLGSLGQDLEDPGNHARNVAAVLVTAEIQPFSRRGDRIDVTVSSIGDARSLEGGILVQTPLYAGNREIYAVAQGVLSSGGSSSRNRFSQAHNTVGTVMNGGQVEREIGADFLENRRVRVNLNRFDFQLLNDTRNKILERFPDIMVAVDGNAVVVDIPEDSDPVSFIAELENIRVQPQYRARVVINERSGTIVMGGDVRIDPVAVSRGGMQLYITEERRQEEYQGIYVPRILTEEERNQRQETRELSGATISEIIEALNAMGASVADIIAILEALKDSGALHAELVVM